MRAALVLAANLFSSLSMLAFGETALAGPQEFAVPKVGDRAVYEITTTKDGRAVSYTTEAELVQFDSETQCYLERDTRRAPGVPDVVREKWRDPGQILTDEKIDQILQDCKEAGGFPTTVTVPAGTFPSCMLPVDADETEPGSGWVWIAHVRFGIARSESSLNGETTVKALRSAQ